jgi:HPt (histidine-containing phosphotransfer) domain-containing protein
LARKHKKFKKLKGDVNMDKLEKLGAWGADIPGTMQRLLNDKELYDNCLQMFVDDENFAALGKSVAAKDYAKPFNEVHTLKGVAGNLGLVPLFDVLSTMTEALRAKDYSKVDEQYADVMKKYDEFKAIVAK